MEGKLVRLLAVLFISACVIFVPYLFGFLFMQESIKTGIIMYDDNFDKNIAIWGIGLIVTIILVFVILLIIRAIQYIIHGD